ncbi:MAG: tryptophan 2,3-dioxygenase family protein [Gammaproteobacteria bacterium]|nr:tryptophan 2,3-dioxygenase family protein [Gammaproteobacteria bacterium]
MNIRPLEDGIHRDLGERMTYDGYLCLDQILNAQQPLSDPPHHDEMLFLIQHQTSELWFKLIIHELSAAMRFLAADDAGPALKNLARVKHVQKQLFEQWSVLSTLTPTEYVQFRNVLGQASGFQSVQYRLVEFLLGNKNRDLLTVFKRHPQQHQRLQSALEARSLYDEFLGFLARRGHAIPKTHLQRDFSEPYVADADVVKALLTIYTEPGTYWTEYELAERLVDVEESFQLWRFRHMKTVERIIGYKHGTGGSSGVGFLKQALDLTFFPELWQVRTEIGAEQSCPFGAGTTTE